MPHTLESARADVRDYTAAERDLLKTIKRRIRQRNRLATDIDIEAATARKRLESLAAIGFSKQVDNLPFERSFNAVFTKAEDAVRTIPFMCKEAYEIGRALNTLYGRLSHVRKRLADARDKRDELYRIADKGRKR